VPEPEPPWLPDALIAEELCPLRLCPVRFAELLRELSLPELFSRSLEPPRELLLFPLRSSALPCPRSSSSRSVCMLHFLLCVLVVHAGADGGNVSSEAFARRDQDAFQPARSIVGPDAFPNLRTESRARVEHE
jgi:hypothetical protein